MTEDLAWNMFMMTGKIDAYLLYKNAEPPQSAAQSAAGAKRQSDGEETYGVFKD